MKNNIFAVVNWKKFAQVAIASAIMFTSTAAMVANPYSADGTIFSVQPITASAEITGNGIANAAKSCGSKAIDKGLDWVFDKLPLPPGIDDLTDYFKGELGGMIKGFLGLEGEETHQMTIEELSSQMEQLSGRIDELGKQLSSEIIESNKVVLEGVEGISDLKSYKERLDSLVVQVDAAVGSLAELNKARPDGTFLTDQEKLVMIAKQTGSSDCWNKEGTLIFNLKQFGAYLNGSSFISDKDFFEAICSRPTLRDDCMFEKEVQEKADEYLALVMEKYLTGYAIAAKAMEAQQIIKEAVRTEDKATFDPDSLTGDIKDIYNDYRYNDIDITVTSKKLKELLYDGNKNTDSILAHYEKFCCHDKKNFINNKTNVELVFGLRTIKGDKEAFEKLYSNNYLTGSDLNELLHTAESAGISVADYLAKNNNPLPGGAKYLLVGETKTDHTVDDHTVYCTDYYTDHVTVIDVNDPTQKHIDLVVSTYNHHVRYGIGAKHFDSKHDQTPVELVSIQQVVTNTKTPFGEMTNDQYHLSSGIYKLGKDVYLNGSISVDNGRTVVIDLNGHKIDRNLQKVGNVGSVINVWKGGNLRLIDSSENGGGLITGGYTANSGGGVFVEEGAECSISDVTISGNTSNTAGGGIYCDGKLTLTDVVVENNSAPKGGGVCGNSDLTIKGGNINNNVARDENGGGIFCTGKLIMSGDFEVSNNTAKLFGGGIFAGEHVEIKDGRIESNKSEAAYGGGLHFDGNLVTTHMEIRNISFIGNESKDGGGAINIDSNYYDVYHNNCSGYWHYICSCTFKNNKTEMNGGAIRYGHPKGSNYHTYIDDSTFEGNVSKCGEGGAIFADENLTDLDIKNSVFTFNQSGKAGGAISSGRSLSALNSLFADNRTDGNGGAIKHFSYYNGNIGLKGCTLERNHGGSGGAIICASYYSSALDDCIIRDNEAVYGGAVTNHGCMKIINSEICGNTASEDGGALYLGNVSNFDYRLKKSDITVSGGNIYDNSAKRGTVLYYAADMNFSFTDDAKYSGSIY